MRRTVTLSLMTYFFTYAPGNTQAAKPRSMPRLRLQAPSGGGLPRPVLPWRHSSLICA